jgi:hypothetical protein
MLAKDGEIVTIEKFRFVGKHSICLSRIISVRLKKRLDDNQPANVGE